MAPFPRTVILRHRKENLKKCSLRGLESREDFLFFTYPLLTPLPDLSNYVLLSLEGKPLSQEDKEKGIFLIDATWRYAELMLRQLPLPHQFERRSLPKGITTAYPRRQEDCPDPSQGLASVEALYLAHLLLGRKTEGLLEHYHWKEHFLDILNSSKCRAF